MEIFAIIVGWFITAHLFFKLGYYWCKEENDSSSLKKESDKNSP